MGQRFATQVRNGFAVYIILTSLSIAWGLDPCVLVCQEFHRVEKSGNPRTAIPLGLPPVPIPANNQATSGRIALGHRLFLDSFLSGNASVSCASCHKPQFAFADSKSFSRGATGKTSSRNAPSLLNVVYFTSFFWVGRVSSLAEQVAGPIESQEEMAISISAVEQRLNADPSYREEFATAWGPGPIRFDMVAESIAAYERTLSANSPFDRWKFGHDETAVSSSVKRGFVVFTSKKKGNCAACHIIGKKYALFTDNKFHDIGVGVVDGKVTDVGRYAVTHNEADRGKFKSPSLRNLALTAPYMHDGSLRDLKQVLDFYIGGGNSHPNLDQEIHPLDFLTGQELGRRNLCRDFCFESRLPVTVVTSRLSNPCDPAHNVYSR